MEKINVSDIFLGEEEAKAMYNTIKSGWVSRGKMVERFEADFCKYTGAKYAIAMNNGTSCLHTALEALGIKQGDDVLVPSLTFISSVNVILCQNANPVLLDSDLKTYNAGPDEFKKRMTKNTKAFIPVDIYGLPADYDSILEVAEEKGVPVVWDSAESLGAEYKGKKIGSVAPIQIFSFYPNKNITTGEGGMLTTDDEELYKKMRIIMNQGQEGRYNHTHFGFNYRMTDIVATLGVEQLKRLPWVIREKDKIAKQYNKGFEDNKKVMTPFIPDYVTQHSWFAYPILVDPKKRDKIVKDLDEVYGVDTRIAFPPVHIQPYHSKRFGYKRSMMPNANDIFSKVILIPMWPMLGKERAQRVIDAINELTK